MQSAKYGNVKVRGNKAAGKGSTSFLRAFTLLFLLLWAGRASAQTVSFKLTPPAAKPKLSETFQVRLELTSPAEYTVRPDTASFSNEVFEIQKVKKISSGTSGALKTDTFELDVSAFQIGVSTFPETGWLLSAGSELKEAKSPTFPIEILPLFEKDKEAGGIRDIHPPFRFLPWLWILAGVLAALAAGYLYRRYLASRAAVSGGAAAAGAVDLRSPYEKADAALTELIASGIWEEGRIKEFYSRLSDIFRTYLDAQFGIKAELMTTNNITRELRGTGADIKIVIKTRELLENSDLVKFAKFKPGEKERDAAVSSLKDLLVFFTQQEENRRALARPSGPDGKPADAASPQPASPAPPKSGALSRPLPPDVKPANAPSPQPPRPAPPAGAVSRPLAPGGKPTGGTLPQAAPPAPPKGGAPEPPKPPKGAANK